MGNVLYFALLLTLAALGGVIGDKLKLPAGGMLGAMIAVIAYNLIAEPPIYMPDAVRVGLQISFGPLLGATITKKDMLGLRKLALPALVMLSCMMVINVIIGISMYYLSNLDVATTLFASAPGGMVDMAIISEEFGANSAYVAILQLSRLMFIFIFMVPFYKKLMKKLLVVKPKEEAPDSIVPEGAPPLPLRARRRFGFFLATLGSACVVGLPLSATGIPAGAIMGAMIGSASFNIMTGKGYFPPRLRLPLQIIAGAFIGLRMDRASLFAMNEIILPIIVLCFGVVLMTSVTAFVMSKLTKLDSFTCVLVSTPGGLSEMSLLADDLGASPPQVAVLHLARLMSVIILFPFMLAGVLRVIL